ncbi:hypothetical protein ANN_00668 [Periplaneta americana]|uniref:HTH psq-type domain-containing protein n=1 Tax=Periplaneta americana TaxID=6978 RepID=A0ABQ8TUC3_PERAM|nr:hypothetical protein ANN_00668 [Periplaneta americana]
MNMEESVIARIESRQLQWYGHVRRMDEGRWPNVLLQWSPAGRKKRGRPRNSWKARILRMMNDKGLNEQDWNDRRRWKMGIKGDISLKGASALYHLPLSTLHDRVNKDKERQVGLIPRVTGKIEHPMVLSGDMEKSLVDRLLYLANRELGLTSLQVKRAAFDLAAASQSPPENSQNSPSDSPENAISAILNSPEKKSLFTSKKTAHIIPSYFARAYQRHTI